MNKTLEAMLRGYLLFDVNGKRYLTYNAAKAARVATIGSVKFIGWHVVKGWVCFYYRGNTTEMPLLQKQGVRND